MILLFLGLAAAAAPSDSSDPGSSETSETTSRANRDKAPVPDEMPAFGTDISVGYLVGTLLGVWPESGVHGSLIARYDAFTTPKTTGGPRLGASFWGSSTLWPLQQKSEDTARSELRYAHYGVLAALRYDPAAPLSAEAGLGFGRLDLEDYWGGPMALPTATFEAGLRHRLNGDNYLSWQLRAHWATQRDALSPTTSREWWLVQFGISPGRHLF